MSLFNDKKGFTLWFTGLSGAGKTTLSHRVHELLRDRGILNAEILDGDVVRTHLSKGLGFDKADRDTNIRRIGWVCHILTKHGIPNMAAAISPYRDIREEVRKMIGNFVEIYVKCPLDVCESRDVKGLYKKARAREIQHVTGVDDPYEEPLEPEVILETDKESVDESAMKVITALERLGYL